MNYHKLPRRERKAYIRQTAEECAAAWNYIGDGINGGQRVLSAIGTDADDVLFISGKVRRELLAQNDDSDPCGAVLKALQNRGRRADKHKKLWRVYEVNHSDLCGKEAAGYRF